ncbi:MAG: peptidylprolyl isomerase [Gemmatimonadetes bacterium]|nr:peptidylprolyl isomerase [Gemmatimonadota bacterium]
MALMKLLRERTHVVMIILVIAFVGLIGLEWGADMTGRGPGGQNAVGSINGESVSYEEMRFEVERQQEIDRQQQGGSVDEFRRREIINEVWDRRVNLTLLEQSIGQQGISVTDAEILEAIRTNPPEYIRQQEMFQTDGEFDQTKYLQALNDPAVEGWTFLEDQYRMLLPRQKLVNRVVSGARVTDLEVRQAFVNQNERLTAKYLLFDPEDQDVEPESISDEDVAAYYSEHPEAFLEVDRVSLSYVMIPKQPSVADSLRVERQIDELYDQLVNGADFENLARDFSEDTSNASEGGNLGFFGRNDMVPEFEAAAFETPPGSISKPVKTEYGWHIIKVEESAVRDGEEQVRARHILLRTMTGQQTLGALNDQARQLQARAVESGLEDAVRSAGSMPDSLQVESTGFFADRPDGFIPGIGYLVGASSFAFASEPGDIGEVLESTSGFYVLENAGEKPAGVLPLEEVELRIRSILVRNRKMEQARLRGEEVRSSLAGGNLDALSGEMADRVATTDPITRQQAFIPRIGQDLNFIKGAFQLSETGELSEVVEGERGYYLIQLESRDPVDETTYEMVKETLKRQLLIQKQNQLYQEWLTRLREDAEIENNLRDFFAI